ncbi:MAG: hypothetical protein RIR10_923, partial [Planctomycetota bacterium]
WTPIARDERLERLLLERVAAKLAADPPQAASGEASQAK